VAGSVATELAGLVGEASTDGTPALKTSPLDVGAVPVLSSVKLWVAGSRVSSIVGSGHWGPCAPAVWAIAMHVDTSVCALADVEGGSVPVADGPGEVIAFPGVADVVDIDDSPSAVDKTGPAIVAAGASACGGS